jgi:hypothetical protein
MRAVRRRAGGLTGGAIAEARRACELTRRGKAPSGGTRDGGRGSADGNDTRRA